MFSAVKVRVVLPAAAACLVLVGACALAFAAWTWAREIRLAEQQVDSHIAAVRTTFVAAGRTLEDRCRAATGLLVEQIAARGGIERGTQVPLAGKAVNDLVIGGRGQAGSADFVDAIARLSGADVTLLSKDGPRFVRIAEGGGDAGLGKALASELDPASKAYAAVSHGQPFYGVVSSSLGVRFVGYEPLRTRGGELVGAAAIALHAELPILATAMDGARLLDSGFVAVVDDSSIQYLPSWVDRKSAKALLDSRDGSWVIERTPLTEWELTVVSAYPGAELQAAARRVGLTVAGAGLAAAAAISAVIFVLLQNGLVQMIGAEPSAATALMRRISDGDLALDGEEHHAAPGTLMDSLRMMQLKLKNLVSAVRGAAAEFGAQAQRFEQTAGEFERGARADAAVELVRQARAVGAAVAILEKTVSRFRS